MFFVNLLEAWRVALLRLKKQNKPEKTFTKGTLLGAVLLVPAVAISEPKSVWNAETEALWDAYVLNLPTDKLQPECLPVRVKPTKPIAAKGLIVAYHGFTACPQQYFGVAQEWANAGYQVLLPLLPGHGRQFSKDNQDDLSDLVIRPNWQSYATFAAKMNQIVEASGAKAISTGLSLGGTLALYATTVRPDLYSKQLIMVPMLELRGDAKNDFQAAVLNRLLRLGTFLPPIGNIAYSWDQWGECSTTERSLGRAGICQYQATHLGATLAFGRKTMDLSYRLSSEHKIPTQFIGVEEDPAINNGAYAKVIRRYSMFNSSASSCFYPSPTNHSLISTFDSPNENKFWLPSLKQFSLNFIQSGEAFPDDGIFINRHQIKRCFIE